MSEEPKDFEDALAELEAIVARLERGQTSLEESLADFERGIRFLRHCRGVLESAETRILELVDIDENGNISLRDFEHEASIPKKTNEKKSKKKASSQKQTEDSKPKEKDPDGLFE